MTELVKAERPEKLYGPTYCVPGGCGKIYVTVNRLDGRIFEVFVTVGKAGGCASAQTTAIGKLISRECAYGLDAEELVPYLKGISCHQSMGPGAAKSCTDAVARAIEMDIEAYAEAEEAKEDCLCGECDYCLDKQEAMGAEMAKEYEDNGQENHDGG